jgi:hypothetical protein
MTSTLSFIVSSQQEASKENRKSRKNKENRKQQ